jgi:hypothetical protein
MATLFDVFIADARVDVEEDLPARDSMGTRLVFDDPLATAERLCLLVHEEGASDDPRFRREVAERASADPAPPRSEDLRGFAVVLVEDGTLAFVDLAVDPPPADL